MTVARDACVLSDLVTAGAARYGERAALSLAAAPTPETVSFLALEAQMCAGAARLLSVAKPGDFAFLHMPARPVWLSALFSIWRAGMVAVPVPIDTPGDTVAALATRLRPGVVVTDEQTIKRLATRLSCPVMSGAALRCTPTEGHVDLIQSAGSDDLAMLCLTSGSTGQPKLVALTHSALLANIRSLLEIRHGGAGDAFLSMLPPTHLFELVTGQLCPLAAGVRVVYIGALLPNRIIDALRQENITRAVVVPALLDLLYKEVVDVLAANRIVEARERDTPIAETARRLSQLNDRDRLSLQRRLHERIPEHFHHLVVGGAAVDPAWALLCRAIGIVLDVGYGLTEAGPVVAVGNMQECPPRSVGRPLPGMDVRVDERGEILVRSPSLMRGYYGDPTATANALVDGWLRTGDKGYCDEQGFLYVTGRLKEAIVTASGVTVCPEEFEVHYQDPLFAELCVIPAPGPHGNDIPELIVVPASEASAHDIESTFRRLRADAPSHCRIERIQTVDQPLPRTPTGKIRRRELAARLYEV